MTGRRGGTEGPTIVSPQHLNVKTPKDEYNKEGSEKRVDEDTIENNATVPHQGRTGPSVDGGTGSGSGPSTSTTREVQDSFESP